MSGLPTAAPTKDVGTLHRACQQSSMEGLRMASSAEHGEGKSKHVLGLAGTCQRCYAEEIIIRTAESWGMK